MATPAAYLSLASRRRVTPAFNRSLPRFLLDLTVYMNNAAGVLKEAGTAYPSRAPEFTRLLLVGSMLHQ